MKKPTKKTPKVEQIKPGHPDYIQPATERIMKLMDKDVSIEDAVKLVKGKDNIHPNTKTDIKKKHDRYSLTKPKMVKLASKAIEDTLAMQGITDSEGNVSMPSHTNRLAAANMVMDRAQPVVRQNLNLNIKADIDPVDLTNYMSK